MILFLGVLVIVCFWINLGWFWGLLALIAFLIDFGLTAISQS
jgi:hypothetical protein